MARQAVELFYYIFHTILSDCYIQQEMNIKRKTRILHYQVHIFFTHSPSAEGIKKKKTNWEVFKTRVEEGIKKERNRKKKGRVGKKKT